ncbi:Crp/Fnr family transcriptional regulator [Roseivirga sp. UBA838]|uniref:Crp/Fnr family transcriptional regulator n=1 Tax=Roseivirga sp. UBA838 TaxID=1947393 RepID=UPI00257B397F|nr:Crp/Fnr family transcriptional regulator [Roseivirga sp. UBA838]|tara:strand:- start:24178 stop:24861 length:684 start_codon:yes stop_codon:yes gene_type:complete
MNPGKNISTKLFTQPREGFEAEVANTFKVKTFKKGEFIYRKGDIPKEVYFMKYGWVKIVRYDEAGNEIVLKILGNNELIGYVPLLQEMKYTNYAQALEYCELYFIPKEKFLALLHKSADFTKLIIQMLCKELWSDEEQIVNLHSKKIDHRLATLLLGLEQASDHSPVHDDSLIRLPKKDMAKIINVSPETLSRYLTRFHDSGLINSVDGTIELLEKEKLHQMSNLEH